MRSAKARVIVDDDPLSIGHLLEDHCPTPWGNRLNIIAERHIIGSCSSPNRNAISDSEILVVVALTIDCFEEREAGRETTKVACPVLATNKSTVTVIKRRAKEEAA